VRHSLIVHLDHTNSIVRPHSYFGSLIGAVVQVIAYLSYILAYIPGGIQTLCFGGQMALRGVGTILPLYCNSLIMNSDLYRFIVIVATKLYSDTIHHLILHLQANGIANSS
jgi:hypothetical protein